MGFIDSINSGNFVILTEIDPPKGTNTASFFETTNLLKGRVDALVVTDMPSAVMKMGSITAGYLLKERGFDPICNITCRDRNILALQSDLLSASALGIENIYITEGDEITFGDHPNARPVREIDANELISIVKLLQEGSDSAENKIEGLPKFNAGAFLNSNVREEAFELEMQEIDIKIKQDVAFFITPAVFDLSTFEKFISRVKHINVPVIASVILLKSVATARFLNKHVDNVNVPDSIIDRLYSAGDKQKESIAITAELINGFKGLCQGVNIMAMGWEAKIPSYLDAVHV